MSWRLSERSVALVFAAVAVWTGGYCAPRPWSIPPEKLADIDLFDPRIASGSDLSLYWQAVCDMRRVEVYALEKRARQIPKYYAAWAAGELPGWRFCDWYYGQQTPVLDGGVVLCGGLAQGEARRLIVQARADVGGFLDEAFDLPEPKYAILVRLFEDMRELPSAIADEFGKHEGIASVAGLTVPPRFVIVPTVLPGRWFWDSDEVLVGRGGKIESLLTFRDIVYHEMVHGVVHGVLAELHEAGKRGDPGDIPVWLHEGLAVYVTEKLKIEPGTKPPDYYRFAAPLHYLEDEWGDEMLRDFVHAAIVDGYEAGLRELPFDEARLLELAEKHASRPASIGTILKSVGYIVAFLAVLVALVLLPALVSALASLVKRAFEPPSAERLELLWLQTWRESEEGGARGAREFVRAYRRAREGVRETFFWEWCKAFLILCDEMSEAEEGRIELWSNRWASSSRGRWRVCKTWLKKW